MRRLCEVYHYTPEQVGRLTLPQIRMLVLDEKTLRGKTTALVGSAEARMSLMSAKARAAKAASNRRR